MQARTAPTSPAAKKNTTVADVWTGGPLQQPPKTPWGRLLMTVVIVALVLNVASLMAFGWYVHRYPNSWLAQYTPRSATTTTTVVQNARETAEAVIPSAVQQARASAYGLARNQGEQGVYRTSDTLGLAWALSGSGWLISVTGAWPTDVKSLVVVPSVGQTQPITSIVKDPGSLAQFLKSTELTAQPLTLGVADDIVVGAQVWVIDGINSVRRNIVRVVEPRWISSELDETYLKLDDSTDLLIGSAVVTNDGQLLGLLGPEYRVWPVTSISSIVKQVIQQATSTRPVFGVRTLNQANARLTNQPTASGYVIGADDGESAVTLKSPADKVGLKVGDIITALDDQAPTASLFKSLQTYQPGDEIKVTYLRRGQEKTVTVTLASSR